MRYGITPRERDAIERELENLTIKFGRSFKTIGRIAMLIARQRGQKSD